MNIKIVNNIQIQLLKFTKKKFSKKYINTKIIPIIKYIVNSDKKKFLISGSQGIGKSTLIKILKDNIEKYFKKRILTLNLDDYYLSKNKREKLSKTKHNLFKTRGVPGTHDVHTLRKNINDFEKSIYPIIIPVFDKLTDNRSNKIRIEKEKKDILILEGWCCGCPPLEKKYLDRNINELERQEDKDKIWRNHFNRNLDNEYKKIFKIFEKIIFMKASSFKFVLNWRSKQEKMNNSNQKNYSKMSKEEMIYFISHYEKITKWMIKKLPNTADLVININDKQEITKNKFINTD